MRPYLPLRGIIGGALIGLSAVVLLQQFAVLYPTRGVTAMTIVGAVLIVLVLANIIRAAARPNEVATPPDV
jgi:ABC-type cobalamin transport system permease subunit